MRLKRIYAIILLSLLFIFPSSQSFVFAHPLSVSYGELTLADEEINYQFSIDDFSVIESTTIDTNQDYLLNEEEVMNGQREVSDWVMRGLTLKLDGETVPPNAEEYRFERRGDKQVVTIVLSFPLDEDAKKFVLEDRLYGDQENYTQFLTINDHGTISEKILKNNNRTIEINLQSGAEAGSLWSSSLDFLKLGMEHIITGYDHLLFLFALLLMKQSLKGYVSIVTAFTIAHSITLTLGYLDIITLPSRLVEAVIALSICYVAVENIFKKEAKWRWLVTFLFGLIHGLGFAGLLMEMEIPRNHLAASLLSFNLGIEIIQIAIVLVLIPVLRKLQQSNNYNKSVKIGSLFIALLGFIWFIERIL